MKPQVVMQAIVRDDDGIVKYNTTNGDTIPWIQTLTSEKIVIFTKDTTKIQVCLSIVNSLISVNTSLHTLIL